MRQRVDDLLSADPLQIPIRLTQSVFATDGIPDTEVLADKVVDCGALSDDINSLSLPRLREGHHCSSIQLKNEA